ncbi:MAG: HAMP domain-containing sensor histidine kinase [Candidatus Delongbacteria bacterium]
MSVIVAVAAAILFTMTANRHGDFKNLLLARDRQRIDSIGKLVASEVNKYLKGESVEDIRSILTFIENQIEIDFISIIGTNDTVSYSTLRKIEGRPSPYQDSSEIAREIGETYVKSYPIEFDGALIGYVQAGYDMTPTKKIMQRSFRKAMGVNFILLSVIFITGWVLSDMLMRPLKDVKKRAEDIARGNFSVRLPVKSKDILGELAKSMNNMAVQLNELTRNMQEKIDRATLTLQKTNQKLQEQKKELKNKNEKLRELDKLKSDLISMVSHELKTPLTSMIGFGKTLLIRDLSEDKIRKYLNIIVSEGNRLSFLVDKFLDVSRIESGEFSIAPHTFELKEFLKDVIEIHRSQSDVEIRPELKEASINVRWDMNAIKQVLLNLLDNAARYNPEGKPIDITTDVSQEKVIIKVRDYGPGIKKENIDKIFDKFYRSDDKVNARNKGTGLGLSISKNIIELHSGSLEARLPSGSGSEFIVKLPREVGKRE